MPNLPSSKFLSLSNPNFSLTMLNFPTPLIVTFHLPLHTPMNTPCAPLCTSLPQNTMPSLLVLTLATCLPNLTKWYSLEYETLTSSIPKASQWPISASNLRQLKSPYCPPCQNPPMNQPTQPTQFSHFPIHNGHIIFFVIILSTLFHTPPPQWHQPQNYTPSSTPCLPTPRPPTPTYHYFLTSIPHPHYIHNTSPYTPH